MTIPDPAERPTITVDELGELLGVSRSTAYESVRNGEIPSIRLGRRIVVPTAAVLRMLQLDDTAASAAGARTAQTAGGTTPAA